MNSIYLWCVTGMSALVAVNTLWRIFAERDRLGREDLTDDDRAFAWRIVIFLIFPFMTFLDLRTTIVATQLAGGSVSEWSYGLLWFHALPQGVPAPLMIPVLFAGAAAESALALCLLPALFFRPHPFLSTLIGYTFAFTFAVNLIVDPLLAAAGLGTPRWHLAFSEGPAEQRLALLAALAAGALVYLAVMSSQRVRLWYSSLSRPRACDELTEALAELRQHPGDPALHLRAGLLYERAGLRRRARGRLRHLKATTPRSLFCPFLEAVLAYRRRDYRTARQSFLASSEFPGVDGYLKGSLLAASACAAFAEGDSTGALNLAERALEFDDSSLVARMVKVDVFLRHGKKEQAGEEILSAMRRGLSMDLERKVPLDVDQAYLAVVRLESLRQQPAGQPV